MVMSDVTSYDLDRAFSALADPDLAVKIEPDESIQIATAARHIRGQRRTNPRTLKTKSMERFTKRVLRE